MFKLNFKDLIIKKKELISKIKKIKIKQLSFNILKINLKRILMSI
jgi:hypothetical protein